MRAFVLEARTLLRLRGIAAYRIGWRWPSPSHCRRSQTYRTGARPLALRLSPRTCTTPAGVRTEPPGRSVGCVKKRALASRTGWWLPAQAACARRYAVTKCLAEEIVAQAVCARGLRSVTLRPRAIFGEDDELLFPKLVDRSVTPPPVLTNGKRCRSLRAAHSFPAGDGRTHLCAPVSSQAAQHWHSTARIARRQICIHIQRQAML